MRRTRAGRRAPSAGRRTTKCTSTPNRWLVTATATAVAGGLIASAGPASAAPAARPSADASNVIVLLRDQHPSLPNTRANQSKRASVLRSDQAHVADRARGLGARNVHQFRTINAVALTVGERELSALAADPLVAAVVPDLQLTLPQHPREAATAAGTATSRGGTRADICPADPAQPLSEPEALQTMRVESVHGNGGAHAVTRGEGVTVGWIADGLDPRNPDFIRNGTSVFSDYQDFTTDGPGAATSGAEAFGDASSIAAQGNVTYDLAGFVNPAHRLAPGCTIKITGVAPGADLVGLKVFGLDGAPTSRFIQAIEYATDTAHVDVLNESFGSDPFPDTQNDPISLANSAAVAAGVTVVASTGDAGITGTIGSPATSKDVIGVGATTMFRSYFQTAFGFSNLPGVTGWANNNISQISSAGFAQNGKVPDVVAPGDSGWALCSPDSTHYTDCTNYTGTSHDQSAIQDFGGTSQSAPLTAGTAALVIAAYRQAHPGRAGPSPHLVKRIITASAHDLGHPAELQGAGQVNALAAVEMARSIPAPRNAERPNTAVGSSLLASRTQMDVSAPAGRVITRTVRVTNLSARTRTLSGVNRALTGHVQRGAGQINFDGSAAPRIVVNAFGAARAYTHRTIAVGPGVDRLDASITFQNDQYVVFLVLVDPNGVFQSYSIPQGAAQYAHVDARHPVAGDWKLYVVASPRFTGQIQYGYSLRAYHRLGTVTPASVRVAPGASETFTVTIPLPANPGDLGSSIRFRTKAGARTTVPMSLRGVLAPAAGAGATFTGAITGGNGRGAPAQSSTYYIDVPAHQPSLAAGIHLDGQGHPNEIVYAYLVSPQGQPLAAQSSAYITADGYLDTAAGVQLFAHHPAPGRWTLVLEATNPVAGDLLSQPFTGSVSLARADVVSTPALPNSAKVVLKAGRAVTVRVRVTNTGVVSRNYFADARLRTEQTYLLAAQNYGDDQQNKDLLDFGYAAQWLVPTRSTSITLRAAANQPIRLDAAWDYGDPQIAGRASGNTSTAVLSGTKLAPGPWYAQAGPIGPFTTRSPRAGTVDYSATVRTRSFDPAVRSSTSDYWPTALFPARASLAGRITPLYTNGWATAATASTPRAAGPAVTGPLTLAPGHSGTIVIQIKPRTAQRGRTVAGTLDIDTFDAFLGTGDQVRGLPYKYTVG